jgi:hypothetical protein
MTAQTHKSHRIVDIGNRYRGCSPKDLDTGTARSSYCSSHSSRKQRRESLTLVVGVHASFTPHSRASHFRPFKAKYQHKRLVDVHK